MQAETAPPVRIERLTKRFGERAVLDGVDLRIGAGEIVALLGPNGAGKTTLLGCLLGLLNPDAGEVSLWNEPVATLSAQTRARIGFVPQTMTGFTWFRIGELMRYLASYRERPGEIEDHTWEHWAGLDPAARVKSLSGGERQRLALVLALRFQPDLIVLDEPVASLDPQARHDFMRLLPDYARRTGASVLVSSHILSDLDGIADRIVILRQGRVRLDSSTARLAAGVRAFAAPPPPEWGLQPLGENADGVRFMSGWRAELAGEAASRGIAVSSPTLEQLFLVLSR